jgi:hypothetical protein
VDLELAREVFTEAATLLHNGLALDGLDEHDTAAAVSALCVDRAPTSSRCRSCSSESPQAGRDSRTRKPLALASREVG